MASRFVDLLLAGMLVLVTCTLGSMAITQAARLLGLVGIEMPGYLAPIIRLASFIPSG